MNSPYKLDKLIKFFTLKKITILSFKGTNVKYWLFSQ